MPTAAEEAVPAMSSSTGISVVASFPRSREIPLPFLQLDLLDDRYPALHGLRVLGILSVVQYHVSAFLARTGIAPDYGWASVSMSVFFGMDLFFVLSGFLIGSILIRSIQSSGTIVLWRFYLRRMFRTFPSYYVVLTALSLAAVLTVEQRRNLWFEYLYLGNYCRPFAGAAFSGARIPMVMPWGWSLALEEQFYFTIPLLFLLLRKLRSDTARVTTLGVLWASALVVRLATYLRHPEWNETDLYNFIYSRTHTRYDALIAGVAIAYVQSRWRERIASWLEEPLSRALVALPSLVCLAVLLQPLMFGRENKGLMHMVSWGSLTGLMYVGWILLLINASQGWIHRVLSHMAFRKIATLGYGVYLIHLPICAIVTPLTRPWMSGHSWTSAATWVATVAVIFVLSLAGSYLLHLFVEKPSLVVRDRLAA
jgi:peptidoglycan/LPS O-acetylase OafA/YrhL